MKITEPGVYDIPVDEYHADPVEGGSLSSSGARKLLPPSCPAIFRHEQDNPPASTDTFDFGHAAHKLTLGAGQEIEVIEADDWRTKAAREARDLAYAEGRIPLLPPAYEQVVAMADALQQHPVASALLNPEIGKSEQTLIWQDRRTGIWRRALVDFLPNGAPVNGRMLPVDYKTTASAHPDAIQKSIQNYGYHQQADWYLDGIRTLGLAEHPKFLFIFQEKAAPYLVTVAEVDVIALRIARDLNNDAIDIYRRCVEANHWPGYSDDIELIPLPAYIENQYLRETA